MACDPWPVDPSCCPRWTDPGTTDAQRDRAMTVAREVLWALTGRRFGVCDAHVRVCHKGERWRTYDTYPVAEEGGTGAVGGGWLMRPYIEDGQWYNCPCTGGCVCELSRIWLPGPVQSIVTVTVGGVVVDPASYRVDDWTWLVRSPGEWPTGTDIEVVYRRGLPPPAVLLAAYSTYACQLLLACLGAGDCRLPAGVRSITRSGVEMDIIDPMDYLDKGLTGLGDVDSIISVLNPRRLMQEPYVWSPDMDTVSSQTWPVAP